MSVNNKVLLLSKKNTDELSIASKLLDYGKLDTVVANSAEEAADFIKSQPFDLVMFNLKKFTEEKLKLAKDLRSLGHTFPVMALASEVEFDTLLKIENLPNTVLLEKPYEDKDLVGLANKLINGREVSQRIYRRFHTNQMANVEVFPTGDVMPSHIFNLSRGGAYIEVPNDASFNKGDIIKLDVRLRQINKRHGLHAKVIWAGGKAIWNKGQAVGVEFLNADNVYAQMLASI